jgi:hypothetical protein
VKAAGVREIFGRRGECRSSGQAADVLLDDEEPAFEDDPFADELLDEESLDDEPVEGALPLSEDLLSEPPLVLAAGALLVDDPRLSVR